MRGTIGDAIGGISNFFTMVIALVAAIYALREAKRTREQHAHENHVQMAREIWRAVFAVTRDIEVCLKLVADGLTWQKVDPAWQLVRASFAKLGDVIADASLFFPRRTFEAVDAIHAPLGKVFDLVGPLSNGGAADLAAVQAVRQEVRAHRGLIYSALIGYAQLDLKKWVREVEEIEKHAQAAASRQSPPN